MIEMIWGKMIGSSVQKACMLAILAMVAVVANPSTAVFGIPNALAANTVMIGLVNGAAGQTVQVPITITGADTVTGGVGAVKVSITYDTAKVSLVKVLANGKSVAKVVNGVGLPAGWTVKPLVAPPVPGSTMETLQLQLFASQTSPVLLTTATSKLVSITFSVPSTASVSVPLTLATSQVFNAKFTDITSTFSAMNGLITLNQTSGATLPTNPYATLPTNPYATNPPATVVGSIAGVVINNSGQTGAVQVGVYSDKLMTTLVAAVGTNAQGNYIVKTNSAGTALPNGTYFIEAFVDVNNNSILDPGEASAAYSDSAGALLGAVVSGNAITNIDIVIPGAVKQKNQFSLGDTDGTSYWVLLGFHDPNQLVQSIVVSGGGLAAPVNLTFAANWDINTSDWTTQDNLTSATVPLAYTFAVTYKNGTVTSYPSSVSFFVADFVASVLPASGSTVTGSLNFSWTDPAGTGLVYEVHLRDGTGQWIWASGDLSTTSFTYNGSPLASGNYEVDYWLKQIDTDGDLNKSLVRSNIIYKATTTTLSGVATNSTTPAMTGSLVVVLQDANYNIIQSAVAAANGAYSFTGVADGSYIVTATVDVNNSMVAANGSINTTNFDPLLNPLAEVAINVTNGIVANPAGTAVASVGVTVVHLGNNIFGTVIDHTGATAGQILVQTGDAAFSQISNQHTLALGGGTYIFSGLTDPAGGAIVTHVRACFDANSNNICDTGEQTIVSASNPITLQNGTQAGGIDFTFAATANPVWNSTQQRNLAGGFLESVSMLTGGVEGWAVGQQGEVLHTADSGATWSAQQMPAGLSNSALLDVAAVDVTHVWIVGRSNVSGAPLMLFYNGTIWSKVTLPASVKGQLMDIQMISAGLGYAVAQTGEVLQTIDGISWSVLSTVTSLSSDNFPALTVPAAVTLMGISVDPLNAQLVWVISQNGIYRSQNGGVSWGNELTAGKFTLYGVSLMNGNNQAPQWFRGRTISVHGNTIVAGDLGAGAIWGTDSKTGAGLQNGGGGILSSQDGGVSWVYKPDMAAGLFRPQMVNATVGFAIDAEATDLNRLFKTIDGGVSWKAVALAGGPGWASNLYFVDATTGWVVGEDDLIVKIDLNPTAVEPVTFQSKSAGGLLESISMLANGTEGWAVGTGGRVLHTVDGGTTWTAQSVPSGLSGGALIDVAAVDTSHVWAVGRSDALGAPLILFYNGTVWSNVAVPVSVKGRLMNIEMRSATIGYAVSQDGSVLGTSDGISWTVLSVVTHPKSLTTGQVLPTPAPVRLLSLAIDPLSPQTLYVFGEMGVNKSIDGGLTWSAELTAGKFTDLDTNTVTGAPIAGRHISVYGNTIVAAEWFWNGILSSQDGGVTWTHTAWVGNAMLRPQMVSATVGFAIDFEMSDINVVYKTTDAGLTWSAVASAGGPAWANGLYFLNQTTGWVVGENDLVVKINLAQGAEPVAFQHNNAGGFLETVAMLGGGMEGWAAGVNGEILHTVDGGLTWKAQAIPAGLSDSAFLSLAAVDATHVWAVGRSGIAGAPLMLFYNGSIWSSVTISTAVSRQLKSIVMLSATVGYAVSQNGSVLGTADGIAWSVLSSVPGGVGSLAVDPLVPNTLWVFGNAGLYKSIDAGVTWGAELSANKYIDPYTGVVATVPLSGRHVSVAGNTIVAGDWNGGVFSSQDAGATWTYAPWQGNSFLRLQMLSSMVGFAVDLENMGLNTVYQTTDGGLSWKPIAVAGAPAWATGMHFINPTTGWVVGENELIVKLSFGTGTGGTGTGGTGTGGTGTGGTGTGGTGTGGTGTGGTGTGGTGTGGTGTGGTGTGGTGTGGTGTGGTGTGGITPPVFIPAGALGTGAVGGTGSISGTVTNKSALTGNIFVAVSADPSFTRLLKAGQANPDGTYTIAGLTTGSYFVGAFLDVNGNAVATSPKPDAGDPTVNFPFPVDVNTAAANAGATTGIDLGMDFIAISGTAKQGVTGIAKIRVTAEPSFDPVTNQMAGAWAETVTNAQGGYTLNMQPGIYRIKFETSYMDKTGALVTVPGGLIGGYADGKGGLTDWMMANLLTVAAGTTAGPAALFTAGVSISGKVVDAAGAAVANAELNVHTTDYTSSFQARSATDGTFTITAPPGLNYQIEIWPGFDPLTNKPVGNYVGGSWIMNPANVTTLNPNYNVNTPASLPVITATSAKNAAFTGVPAGTLPGAVMGLFDPHLVTTITLDASVQIVAQVDAGTIVNVRLVDGAGAGIANAWVDLGTGGATTDAKGYALISLPSAANVQQAAPAMKVQVWPGFNATTQMQDNSFIGGAVIGNVTAGYNLAPDLKAAITFANNLSNWPTIDLDGAGPGTKTGLFITAAVSQKISGTVTDGGNPPKPIAKVWVNAWSPTTGYGNGAQTDAQGNYAIAVENGVYEVGILDPNYIAPASQSVTIAGASQAAINFTLGAGNTIAGRVTNASGVGVAGLWVNVSTPINPNATPAAAGVPNMFGASTDVNGFYSVSVKAGAYIAVVYGWGADGTRLYQDNYYLNGSSELNATRIDASLGSVAGVDFIMSQGNAIGGTITGLAQGERLSLSVWSDNTSSWGGVDLVGAGTGSDVYNITGLPNAADYRLSWKSDTKTSGAYGGTPGTTTTTPVDWFQASLLDITQASINNADITLNAGTNLVVTVNGLQQGDSVDVNLWSDKLQTGGWGTALAGANGNAVINITGLTPATDYRLWVEAKGTTAQYKNGNYKAAQTAGSAGTLVNFDNATLIDMTTNQTVLLAVTTGNSIAGTITGLPVGVKATIDAVSRQTKAFGSTEVIGTGKSVTYKINGLDDAVDYRVFLRAEGVDSGFYDGTGTALTTFAKAATVSATLAGGQNVTGINLPLVTGKSISGTVNGLAAGGHAFVEAWSDSMLSWSGSAISGSGSGADTYSLSGLTAAADYSVKLKALGFQSQSQSPVDVSVANVTGLNFTLSAGGSIAGSITGLKPNEWAWISASSGSKLIGGAGVVADKSGAAIYTIDGLADAAYRIQIDSQLGTFYYAATATTLDWNKATTVAVLNNSAVTGKNLILTAAATTHSISGTINGLPAGSNLAVDIYAWSDTGGWGSATRTGNGSYTVTGLAPGNYVVSIAAPGFVEQFITSLTVNGVGLVSVPVWGATMPATGPVVITDPNGVDITGLNVTVSAGQSVSGSVVDVNGVVVAGAQVSLWNAVAQTGGSTETDANGLFTITDLAPNTYSVDVWTPTQGTVTSTLTVANVDITGQTLTVVKAVGQITGTITVKGAVKPFAIIMVVDSSTGVFVKAAVTDAKGQYVVDNLDPAVVYRVDVDTDDNPKTIEGSTANVSPTTLGTVVDMVL